MDQHGIDRLLHFLPAPARRMVGALPAWGWAVCLLVTALGVAVSWLAYRHADHLETRALQAEFDREVEQTMNDMVVRLGAHEQLLLAAAMLERNPRVDRQGWWQFTQTVKLRDRYRGLVGLGYAAWDQARAPITVIEPMTGRNQQAIGFDVFGEEARRQALMQARDSGKPAMTRPLTLWGDAAWMHQTGMVLYVPVYRAGLARETAAQRQAALQGWVFSRYRVSDFMASIDVQAPDITLEVYEGEQVLDSQRLYPRAETPSRAQQPTPAAFAATRPLELGQRRWVVHFATQPSWEVRHQHHSAYLGLVAGLLLTFSSVGLLAFLIGHRAHALRLVRQITQALSSSEAKYKQLVEAQSDLIAVIALDGTLRFVNTACARFLGQSPEALLGQCLFDLVWPNESEQVRQHVAQLLDEHLVSTAEHRVIDAQGKERWIAWTSTLQESPYDAQLQIHLVGRDMTERHELEEQLKDREQRYRGLFEHLQGGFALNEVLLDDQGLVRDFRFLAVNDAFSRLTGWPAAKLLGRTARELNLVDPQELEVWIKSFGRVALGHGNLQFERLSSTFGRWVDVVVYRPAVNQFALVLHDASERHRAQDAQRAQAEAEAANRAKTLFLANMSHEIRTPLHAVMGCAQIGLRDAANAASRALFQRIRDAGQHLLDVVNDILDFSKIESGKFEIDVRPHSVQAVVHGAVDMLRDRAQAKRLALRLDLADAVPQWVALDAMRVEQILVNLLSNAVKFTQQGVIGVAVRVSEDRLQLEVSDTGMGMSPEQLARVFSPFEQADKSITRQFGGTGLGLAISANLAQLLGGQLTARSVLAVGSSFTLSLPLVPAQPPQDAGRMGSAPLPEQVLSGLRILVVDDVEVNRMIIEDLLCHRGARVSLAEDGQEALDMVENMGARYFNAILMDVQMPVMDGVTAAERLQTRAPGVPVIALTAHAFAQERERCLAAGMMAHVNKPVDENTLVRSVAHWCGVLPDQAAAASPLQPPSLPLALPPAPPLAPELPPALVDWPALARLYGKKPGLLERAVQSVLDHNQETAARLRQAAAAHDHDALVFISHSLKGVAGHIQASILQDCARQAEQAARDHDPQAEDRALALADELERVLITLDQDLHDWIAPTP